MRPAQEADQSAIKKLIREAGINPFGLHWSRFIVAVDDNQQITGCGQVKSHRDGSLELASLAVHQERRNQGIAGAIIRELQEKHGRPLWLTCMDRLVPFYEPFGFVVIDELSQMPRYFRTASRFFNLFWIFSRGNGRLAVMVWR